MAYQRGTVGTVNGIGVMLEVGLEIVSTGGGEGMRVDKAGIEAKMDDLSVLSVLGIESDHAFSRRRQEMMGFALRG